MFCTRRTGSVSTFFILPSSFELKKCQGDHGRCRADYRCCLPALAGFISPQSMGPGNAECAADWPLLQVETNRAAATRILSHEGEWWFGGDFRDGFSQWFAGLERAAPQSALEGFQGRKLRSEVVNLAVAEDTGGMTRWPGLVGQYPRRNWSPQPAGRPATARGHHRCSQACHHLSHTGDTSTRATNRRA